MSEPRRISRRVMVFAIAILAAAAAIAVARSSVPAPPPKRVCTYKGEIYSTGAIVNTDTGTLRCELGGAWISGPPRR